MASIHKLTKNGQTIYPATTTDAVVHPDLAVSSSKLIEDVNVSKIFPTGGIDGTNKYTLETAIAMIPASLRNVGIKCSFIDDVGELESWEYNGGSFTSTSGWRECGVRKLTELESKTLSTDVDVFWANVVKAETDGSIIDAVLGAKGEEITGFSGFRISPYIAISADKSYYYIPQSISANYANICFYDKNKDITNIIVGGLLPSGKRCKLVVPAKAKYVRCTYSNADNYIYSSTRVDDLRVIQEFNGYQIVKRGDILPKNLVQIPSTFEEGIFGKQNSDYHTSDYIEIPTESIYTYLAEVFTDSFKLIEFYDSAKNTISTIMGGVGIRNKVCQLIPPIGAKYIRYAKAVYHTSNGLFTFNGATLENQVSEQVSEMIDVIEQDAIGSLYSPLPNIVQKNLVPIDITFEDGIFGSSNSGFYTSNYIEIDLLGKSYVWVNRQEFSKNYNKLVYYDKDKNVIASIPGNVKTKNIPVLLNPPRFAKYIRFATYGKQIEIYLASVQSFESAVKEVIESTFSDNNYILWIGTSIPEGATYPKKASEKCGYRCINKSLGSSQLRFTNQHPTTIQYWSGRCLTARVAELEALYRADVNAGTISESKLEEWKNYSFERSILPYIDGTNANQISMLVIDHGFNDRSNIHELLQNENTIDWESRDRSSFVGAFNFLMDEIFSLKPFMKVVISGYFQDKYEPYYSKDICKMQRLISEHYGLTLLPAWEHTQISDLYVPNSSNYLAEFNAKYGTNYKNMKPDANGNILFLQLYCPDRVHPNSDKTGNSDKRLDAVYSKLLRDAL